MEFKEKRKGFSLNFVSNFEKLEALEEMDHLIEKKPTTERFINKLFHLALDGFPSGKFFPFQVRSLFSD